MKNFARKPADKFWQPSARASGPYRRWLIDDDSLTRRLQSCCTKFSVAGVEQHWIRPLPDEARLLGLRPAQTALVREVTLLCGNIPLVFARSVLPRASLSGAWRDLGALGSRPLGAVLFADHKVRRTPLTFVRLRQNHPISSHLGHKGLWARRSVFARAGRAILVTEVFLPGVLAL